MLLAPLGFAARVFFAVSALGAGLVVLSDAFLAFF
jgi:hypothetical protein